MTKTKKEKITEGETCFQKKNHRRLQKDRRCLSLLVPENGYSHLPKIEDVLLLLRDANHFSGRQKAATTASLSPGSTPNSAK
ncbi:MAG: hypothetical protein V2B20_17045 [Pseudomonadota bacterium]